MNESLPIRGYADHHKNHKKKENEQMITKKNSHLISNFSLKNFFFTIISIFLFL